MQNNKLNNDIHFNNFVYKHIRKSSVFSSILMLPFLILVIFICFKIPFKEIFFPLELSVANSAKNVYESGVEYVELTLSEVHYTGYDSYRRNKKIGSYYYSLVNNNCTLILIENKYNNPPKQLTDYKINARLIENSDLSETVIKKLAKDIDWTVDGLNSVTSNITIDETAYHKEIYLYVGLTLVTLIVIFISIIIKNIIYIIFPGFHPACIFFTRLGGSIKELNKVNYEVNNDVILKADNIVLTEKYIISATTFNLEIIPIRSILWIYEHIPSHHQIKNTSSHTLIFVCRHKIYFDFKRISSDSLSEVIKYIENRYPSILIGYSKENHDLTFQKINHKK